jgi:prevent-host-death family protein
MHDVAQIRTVTSSQLKRDLDALIDEIRETRERIVVTWHGKAVAQLVPYVARDPFDADASLAPLEVADDAFAPVATEDWPEELR